MPSRLSAILATLLALAVPASAAFAGEGKKEEKKDELPPLPQVTHEYVHSWKALPSVPVRRLSQTGDDGDDTVRARAGAMTVVVFLASWCEPCQQLMPDLARLEKRYSPRLSTDVYYVFSHDTVDDAVGFMKQYGIKTAYLANDALLTAYHDPELPTIVVADRHGWLTGRYPKAGSAEVAKLDEFLKVLTAY